MESGAMEKIRLNEETVRELTNENLITLLIDFGFFVVENDGKEEEIVLSREALIQKAVHTTMDYYTIVRTNCDSDEEAHGRYILDCWIRCWEYC